MIAMIYQGNDKLEISDEFGFLRKHGAMYQEETNWVLAGGNGILLITEVIIVIACIIAIIVCCGKIFLNIHSPTKLAEEKSLLIHRLGAIIGCSLAIGIVTAIHIILATV